MVKQALFLASFISTFSTQAQPSYEAAYEKQYFKIFQDRGQEVSIQSNTCRISIVDLRSLQELEIVKDELKKMGWIVDSSRIEDQPKALISGRLKSDTSVIPIVAAQLSLQILGSGDSIIATFKGEIKNTFLPPFRNLYSVKQLPKCTIK